MDSKYSYDGLVVYKCETSHDTKSRFVVGSTFNSKRRRRPRRSPGEIGRAIFCKGVQDPYHVG